MLLLEARRVGAEVRTVAPERLCPEVCASRAEFWRPLSPSRRGNPWLAGAARSPLCDARVSAGAERIFGVLRGAHSPRQLQLLT